MEPNFSLLELLESTACKDRDCRCNFHKMVSKMIRKIEADEDLEGYGLEVQRRYREQLEIKGEI